MYHSLAVLTGDVRLQPSTKCLVYNATTVTRIQDGGCLTTRVMVEYVEGRDEELMGVLLFVAGKMAGVSPDEV